DLHAKAAGRDMADAPADPSHAQDAQRQFIELAAAYGIADFLKLVRRKNLIAKCDPRPEKLKQRAENKIADSERVGIGRVNHLDAPRTARGHVNVVDADSAPTDDAEFRRFGQQGFVDARVCPDK